jgi:hypothetical protein
LFLRKQIIDSMETKVKRIYLDDAAALAAAILREEWRFLADPGSKQTFPDRQPWQVRERRKPTHCRRSRCQGFDGR